MADEKYLFHQTPAEVAAKLVAHVPHREGQVWAEPFRGEGAFWRAFPDTGAEHVWAEITQGRDFRDLDYSKIDTVVTNPPFRLPRPDGDGRRQNSFWLILDYLTGAGVRETIALLGNDYCLSTLTPRRIRILAERGWYVNRIVVTGVKKWRGRYYLIVLGREDTGFYRAV